MITLKKILAISSAVLFSGVIATSVLANNSDGARVFKKNCQICHGHNGNAKTRMAKMFKLSPLGDITMTDEEIENVIVNGKGKMRKYGKKLNKHEISSLVEFVKSLKK